MALNMKFIYKIIIEKYNLVSVTGISSNDLFLNYSKIINYLQNPFDSKELVARVRAVLRRFQPKQAAVVSDEKCATYPDLIVNLTNYSVTYMGKQVDMPPKELELL